MTIWSNTAEGSANGTVATAAATATGGDAFNVSSGSPVFSTARAKRGTGSYYFTGASTQLLRKTFPSGTTSSRFQGWFNLGTSPGTEIVIWQPRTTSDTVQGALRVNTARDIFYRDASSNQTNIASALTLNTWYRVAILLNSGTGAGTATIELYNSSNAVIATQNITGVINNDLGTISHQIGKVSGTSTGDIYWDDVSFSDTGGSLLPALASVVPAPVFTVNAPADANPGATVNLTTTVSSGTPDAWTWTQTSGPTVTLTGTGGSRSYVAPYIMPPATNVVIQASATESTSAAGTASGTTSILPTTDWSRVPGGSWRGAPVKVLNTPA